MEGPTGMLAGVVGTIQTLSSAVPNGVITTLPDPTNTAAFNTVPYNSIPLTEGLAAQLNAGLVAPYNGGLAAAQAVGLISADEVALRTLNAVVGNNPILIEDEDLTDLTALGLPSVRLANANDKINLFALQNLGTVPDPNLSLIHI